MASTWSSLRRTSTRRVGTAHQAIGGQCPPCTYKKSEREYWRLALACGQEDRLEITRSTDLLLHTLPPVPDRFLHALPGSRLFRFPGTTRIGLDLVPVLIEVPLRCAQFRAISIGWRELLVAHATGCEVVIEIPAR